MASRKRDLQERKDLRKKREDALRSRPAGTGMVQGPADAQVEFIMQLLRAGNRVVMPRKLHTRIAGQTKTIHWGHYCKIGGLRFYTKHLDEARNRLFEERNTKRKLAAPVSEEVQAVTE